MSVICYLKPSPFSIPTKDTLIRGHHISPRQPFMSLSSIFLFYNQSPIFPQEESSTNMDLFMSLPYLKTLTSSLFSLGNCPQIPVPRSQPLLCNETTSWVSSHVLLHHPSQFLLLPHWTTSGSGTMQFCIYAHNALSDWNIFSLPLYVWATSQPGYSLFKILSLVTTLGIPVFPWAAFVLVIYFCHFAWYIQVCL